MKKQFLLVLGISLLLGGCGGSSSAGWSKTFSFASSDETKEISEELPGVNPYIWKASLEKLNFMPLLSTDAKGGVIVTDWEKMENSNESFKITVNVTSQQLRADGVEVQVFKRELRNGKWADVESDKKLAVEIEKSILTEARKMFRRDVMGREV